MICGLIDFGTVFIGNVPNLMEKTWIRNSFTAIDHSRGWWWNKYSITIGLSINDIRNYWVLSCNLFNQVDLLWVFAQLAVKSWKCSLIDHSQTHKCSAYHQVLTQRTCNTKMKHSPSSKFPKHHLSSNSKSFHWRFSWKSKLLNLCFLTFMSKLIV